MDFWTCNITVLEWERGVSLQKSSDAEDYGSEATGRVVHRKGFAKTCSTNIVEGAGHT